jgi:hypothetical protein
MRRAWAAALAGALLWSGVANAGNTDEVNAGLDVTLTGGAVVANVYTGAALWYNPAGLARIDKPSLELTGVTLNIQVVKNPGLLTIDTMPQGKSEGAGTNFSVTPQALTFTIKLKNENLKLGVGLFNCSSRSRQRLLQEPRTPMTPPPARFRRSRPLRAATPGSTSFTSVQGSRHASREIESRSFY